jgi:phosphatidylserine decarboxylase
MGDKFLKIMYDTAAGRFISKPVVYNTFASKLYGKYADLPISKRLIGRMVKDLNINLSEYKQGFNTLNSFFAREKLNLKFDMRQDVLVSPCEANISVWQGINKDSVIQAKNHTYKLEELIGVSKLAEEYNGGTCIRFRLSPYHYHRAHFFDDARIVYSKNIKGALHTVNPLAWSRVKNMYCENKRVVNILKTNNFKDVIMIEIGALFVGSIIHSAGLEKNYTRGEELSYFKFGGSMIIMLLKKDSVTIDQDILLQTELGYETKVKVGEKIGRR